MIGFAVQLITLLALRKAASRTRYHRSISLVLRKDIPATFTDRYGNSQNNEMGR